MDCTKFMKGFDKSLYVLLFIQKTFLLCHFKKPLWWDTKSIISFSQTTNSCLKPIFFIIPNCLKWQYFEFHFKFLWKISFVHKPPHFYVVEWLSYLSTIADQFPEKKNQFWSLHLFQKNDYNVHKISIQQLKK